MSALAALHCKAVAGVAFRLLATLVGAAHRGVKTSGAAHIELALALGVEIDEYVSLQYARFEGLCSGHSGLFVVGHQYLYWSVLDLRRLGHCQCKGHSKAVVRTQSGAACLEPIAFHAGLNRVVEEVVGGVAVLLGNHVHVSLQYHALAVFVARGGRNTHDYIACLVGEGLYIVSLAPVEQVLANLLLVL